MKYKYMIPGLVIFLFACSGLKSAQPVSQGLSGYIYLVRGNQMPSPGRPISKGRGVSRDIYIYEPTSVSQTQGTSPVFDAIKTRLIAHTKSDTTGRYHINLPVGKYSVFVKDNGKFFAAESNGEAILNPVEVFVKTFTQKDIIINNKAAY
jgi:hypothetical protein